MRLPKHLTARSARQAARGLLRRLRGYPSGLDGLLDQACPACRCTGQCPTTEDVAVGLFALTLPVLYAGDPWTAWDAQTEDQRRLWLSKARFVLDRRA